MTSAMIDDAAATLENIVVGLAMFARQVEGFGWVGDPGAPTDYAALCQAYERSRATGAPLPVSDANNEQSIYPSVAANLAFRYWHDVTHVRMGCDFGLEGETRVALAQLDALRGFGFEPSSHEYRLLFADTFGQTVHNLVFERFPTDQVGFARATLASGVPQAIRRKIRTSATDSARNDASEMPE
jgi:hypothetical protein